MPNRARAILFFVNLVIWTYAGYAIGETRGRGWRGAMTSPGQPCRIVCRLTP